MTNTTLTLNPVEYRVILETVEVDEYGAGYELSLTVPFYSEPDWKDWLSRFNQLKGEEHWIKAVYPVNTVNPFDFDEF